MLLQLKKNELTILYALQSRVHIGVSKVEVCDSMQGFRQKDYGDTEMKGSNGCWVESISCKEDEEVMKSAKKCINE